ncbi:MAG: hypothetical protein CMJ67_10620 [Planctomycetaceae bacterium]|nr:hypothetical protein [Planctomycetaceae bacterium]
MDTARCAVGETPQLAECTACDQAVEATRSGVAAEFLEGTLDLVRDVAVEFIYDTDARRHVGAAGVMDVNTKGISIPLRVAQRVVFDRPLGGESLANSDSSRIYITRHGLSLRGQKE